MAMAIAMARGPPEMPQLIIDRGFVECPACGLHFTKESEQDGRVAVMRHPKSSLCLFDDRLLRVDRINGYAEAFNEA
jgi:hypothetical protein